MTHPAGILWTIGHGARTLSEFLGLLGAHGIGCVADVRRVPRSKRHPHFDRERLARFLAEAGVGYRHLTGLGGMRDPDGSLVNAGLRERAFRGYADHMQTDGFAAELDALVTLASERPTAILCAESAPEHCHRSLIADALVARRIVVRHITGPGPPVEHRLAHGARNVGGRVRYPATQAELGLSLES